MERNEKGLPQQNKPLPTGVKNIKGRVITNPEKKKKDNFISLQA